MKLWKNKKREDNNNKSSNCLQVDCSTKWSLITTMQPSLISDTVSSKLPFQNKSSKKREEFMLSRNKLLQRSPEKEMKKVKKKI